ncbi:succinate dehydrogenase cytochrome b560 subunit, mitochondrial [Elysia marginata]|uniref:Succinate dehydrogenase cytochrome b560 subunit, mitochondrial n=1 Tax=Elysia marginata TaxID=1093978 RepID=A0AAV4FF52_9GAST|nr:succinate dehydrogenase cytochrome b560 subunit, mitochondrial [Elysia marginata]
MLRFPVCRQLVQHCLLRPNVSSVTARSTMSTRMTAYEEMSNYWAKNRKLNRPLSPHLSVYKFHMTMAISITNRVTGSAQQAILTGAPLLLLCLPGDFTSYFNAVREMDIPSPVIYGLKFLLAFPFAFHLMAGLRHLVS